jgi:Flp pilus assembly protein TadD
VTFEQAEKGDRRAVPLRSEDLATLHDRGTQFLHQGKPAEAEQAFRKIIRSDPEDAEAHYHLGLALWEQEKYAEAEQAFRELVRLHPDKADRYYFRGLALWEHRKHRQKREPRRTLPLGPADPGVHRERRTGLTKGAALAADEREFREALQFRPDDFRALKGLAVLLDGQGRRKEARKFWERLAKLEKRRKELDLIKGRLDEEDSKK